MTALLALRPCSTWNVRLTGPGVRCPQRRELRSARPVTRRSRAASALFELFHLTGRPPTLSYPMYEPPVPRGTDAIDLTR